MRYAIWGAGRIGLWLKTAIAHSAATNIEVICFGDNNANVSGKKIDGVEVLPLDTILAKYRMEEIDAVVIATRNRFVEEIVRQLYKAGIGDIFMFPEYLTYKRLDEVNVETEMIHIDAAKPRLNYFEYHVADHCNLNCKGCGHYCPLVTEPSYGNYELYVRDIKRLKELFWGIETIRLMGGEPLLNEELYKFIIATREVFPDVSLHVVTNGLLVDKQKTELFQIMRENSCELDVSRYKPTEKVLPKIKIICELHAVKCNVGKTVETFFKVRSVTVNSEPEKAWKNCVPYNHLRDGKMSVCGGLLLISVLNNAFGLHILPGKEDIIDIFDESISGWDLINKLSTQPEMCKYCKEKAEQFEWKVAGRNVSKEDWLIERIE